MTPDREMNSQQVVSVLADALPFIRRFRGSVVVVKYGGNAMTEPALKDSFARDITWMSLVGMRPVVVHGGGPQIGELLSRIGKQSEFVQGMRVTDRETMDVVEMVLGGQVNKDIVSLISSHGGRAVGISGRDGNFIRARRMLLPAVQQADGSGVPVDLGQVGEVDSIDTSLVELLVGNGFIPVVAPIGSGESGEAFNINADLVAGQLATAIGAEKLLLLTNTPGVLDEHGELLRELDLAGTERLINSGVIAGGMLPKVRCALDAVAGGVRTATVLDGRVDHALLLELFTQTGVGTQFVADAAAAPAAASP